MIRVFTQRAIRLGCPYRVSVIVFNKEGARFLIKVILSGITYLVLPQRDIRFFSLSIFFRFLVKLHLAIKNEPKLTFYKRLSFFIGSTRRVYLLACIEAIAPKVVITYIDNDYDFQWLSSQCDGIVFIAVQNGVRSDYDLSKWLPAAPHPASVISLPHYYCFGKHEIDLYSKYGYRIKQFYPVGSLRGSYYFHHFSLVSARIENRQICLISQWGASNLIRDCFWPEFYLGFNKLCEYLKRYVIDNKTSIVVALRGSSNEERAFFTSIFGEHAFLIRNDPDLMSSYSLVNESKLTITIDSTLGREAFSWGKRVLFCNMTGDQNYSCPTEGIWSLVDPTYQQFFDRLTEMLCMNQDQFTAQTKHCANYFMQDPRLVNAHEEIRKHILSVLI